MKIILVGCGKVLYFLAKTFLSKGSEVSIISNSEEDCKDLAKKLKALVICGDGSDPRYLEEAGAYEADAVAAITESDADNLVICQLSEKRFRVPKTIALVNDPGHEATFQNLGVTAAFSTTRIISSLIEQKVAFEEITNLIPLAEGKVTITQITLRASSEAIGKTVSEIAPLLPQESLLACILRNGQVVIPRGGTQLFLDDRVIVIATPSSQAQTLTVLGGPEQ